ncbi:uncharacterized protein LOC134793280 [Cydia splendana]|uniref:uncharacterized protein LOC134793280 n=1 Tax=Cydia splendana TaxID=1100963 RepID=UPI00300CBB1D
MPETSALSRAGGPITENDAEQESDSEPGGFALSVDLSACMGPQARCRVWVRRRARKVRWLASRVRRVAKIKGPLLLLAGDHLLPPSEPIKVLRHDDIVRVARVEHKWQHAFSIEDSDEDSPMLTQPPIQPQSVIQNGFTTSTKQNRPKKSTTEQQEATNINQQSSVMPAHPTKPLSIIQNNPTTQTTFAKQNSPKKTKMPEPAIDQQSPVARKRKFTVGDTLLWLKRAEESRTEAPPKTEPEKPRHSKLSKLIEHTSKLEEVAQKFTAMDQSVPIDNDALNQVKRRALALLEQVTDEKDADVVDAPKKKRRRVRRRRPVKLSNQEFIQDLDSESGTQNGSQLNSNHLDLTKEQDVQNGFKESLKLNNHVDLTKEQEDLESKAMLIKSITLSPDKDPDTTKEDQDSESDDSNTNRSEKQPASTAQPLHSVQSSKAFPTPTMLAAQPSPTWTVDFIDMPPETQIPVLVRDATPRPPRVVRALGTETRCDTYV